MRSLLQFFGRQSTEIFVKFFALFLSSLMTIISLQEVKMSNFDKRLTLALLQFVVEIDCAFLYRFCKLRYTQIILLDQVKKV